MQPLIIPQRALLCMCCIGQLLEMDSQEKEWRKGPWTPEEDKLLSEYVKVHGEGRWTSVATGSGKSSSYLAFEPNVFFENLGDLFGSWVKGNLALYDRIYTSVFLVQQYVRWRFEPSPMTIKL